MTTVLNYSRILLVVRFSRPVKYLSALTPSQLKIWARPQIQARLLQTQITPNFTILSYDQSQILIQLTDYSLGPSYIFLQPAPLAIQAQTFSAPSSGLVQLSTQSSFISTGNSYPESVITAALGLWYPISLYVTTVAILLIALLALLRAGDLTRHLTDQLQMVWMLAYIGSNQTVNLDAFTQGFFGSVFGIFRPAFPKTDIEHKLGTVDGGSKFA